MRLTTLALITLALAGCLAQPRAIEYIDSDTASTVTVATSNWIFARERTDLAVHAQDYINITPVQLNRNGKRQVYLYCQLWSTIDRRGDKTIVPANAQLSLIADDRRVVLPATATDTRRLGFGRPPVDAPSKSTEIRAAAIDVDLLRFAINANQVRIALSIDGVTEYFLPWKDGRKSARDFLQSVAIPP